MNEEEIIDIFCNRAINTKVNNYIFTGVEDFKILNSIPDICGVSFEGYNIGYSFCSKYKDRFRRNQFA